MKDSNFLEKISKIVEKNIFNPSIKNIDNNVDFFNYVKKQLNKHQFNSNFVNFNDFLSMYSIIELSYIYHSSKNLKNYEYKGIISGDIGKRITYSVENYSKTEYISEISDQFFDNIELVKLADKESEKLNTLLFDILIDLTMNYKFFSYLNASILGCVHYLELCNALKNKKLQITAEDVVVAFLTTMNILMTDIREFIPIIDKYKEKSIKTELSDYKDKLLFTFKGNSSNDHGKRNFDPYIENLKHSKENIINKTDKEKKTIKDKESSEPERRTIEEDKPERTERTEKAGKLEKLEK